MGANPALVAAPAAGGVLGAHALAYRIAGGGAEPADHAYLTQLAFPLTLLATLALAGLWTRAARGRGAGRVPAWPFATLPPLAFAVQEHLERLLPGGHWPVHLLGQRVFLVGLALQLPFALLAWLLARGLAAAADAVGAVLARRNPPRLRPRSGPVRAPGSLPLRAPLLEGSRAARGPPAASVA